MTRYLMTLEDSVNLVFHAFENAISGDIFVQKSPASTIGDLVLALKEIFNYQVPDKIIGTRHGEKLYETLLSREEMARAEDQGNYYRIPQDNRNLNYEKYFIEGEEKISNAIEYTSHNTTRLNKDQTIEVLLKLELIKESINESINE